MKRYLSQFTKFVIVFWTLTVWGMPTYALDNIDARQVAVNVDERDEGQDQVTDLEMTLTNKQGQQRVRKVQMYRKEYGPDEKMVMFFLEPADVKGTGFLSWDYQDASKDDEQWLYLPALKKVRRIASSNKSDSFMGTDFTYTDMGGWNVDDYTYKSLPVESLDGIECYHIERLPKDDKILKETGYGRTEIWVRPDIWLMVKVVFYDKKLNDLKTLMLSDIEQIDGIWTAKTYQMKNVQENHQTTFKFSNHTYNSGLEDEIFTDRRLQQGVK